MTKNHLKRISSPRTWILDRKSTTFTVRPNAGGHSFENGLPLGIVIRDMLGLAKSMTEVKKILNNNEILVDGKRRKDHRFIVGLFDVLKFSLLNKSYRLTFDKKGRIVLIEIDDKESNTKVCKIVGKSLVKKGKIQYHLHDGKSILSEVQAKVGDTLLISLPTLEIKSSLPFQEGVTIFLTKGRYAGDVGQLESVRGDEVIYIRDGKKIETSKNYAFVVGKEKAEIKIKDDN
jgi:small subunit ribosomal protein S4e